MQAGTLYWNGASLCEDSGGGVSTVPPTNRTTTAIIRASRDRRPPKPIRSSHTHTVQTPSRMRYGLALVAVRVCVVCALAFALRDDRTGTRRSQGVWVRREWENNNNNTLSGVFAIAVRCVPLLRRYGNGPRRNECGRAGAE